MKRDNVLDDIVAEELSASMSNKDVTFNVRNQDESARSMWNQDKNRPFALAVVDDFGSNRDDEILHGEDAAGSALAAFPEMDVRAYNNSNYRFNGINRVNVWDKLYEDAKAGKIDAVNLSFLATFDEKHGNLVDCFFDGAENLCNKDLQKEYLKKISDENPFTKKEYETIKKITALGIPVFTVAGNDPKEINSFAFLPDVTSVAGSVDGIPDPKLTQDCEVDAHAEHKHQVCIIEDFEKDGGIYTGLDYDNDGDPELLLLGKKRENITKGYETDGSSFASPFHAGLFLKQKALAQLPRSSQNKTK